MEISYVRGMFTKTLSPLFIILVFCVTSVSAQLRNLPVYHAPDYGHRYTITMDYGHSGEADGQTIIWGINYAVAKSYPRFLVGAGLGIWDPRVGNTHSKFSFGGTAAVRVWPAPSPLSIRLQSGFGIHWTEGDEVKSIPIGAGIGFVLPIPVAKLEFWATPRAQYRSAGGNSDWNFCSSFGINIGVAGQGGFRIALDLCDGEVGFGYGFALWF